MEKLKQRWQIKSNFQLIIIFTVFAITGSSASYISKPFLALLNIDKNTYNLFIYWFLRIVLIFPFYQVLLVFFGFIFGEFAFFWNFEKKMLRAMKLGFIVDAIESKRLKK
jgi:hypothetical protein